MIEKINTNSEGEVEWKQIATFGKGIIYAAGNERKMVTPGLADFNYQVKPELTQRTKVQSPQRSS